MVACRSTFPRCLIRSYQLFHKEVLYLNVASLEECFSPPHLLVNDPLEALIVAVAVAVAAVVDHLVVDVSSNHH